MKVCRTLLSLALMGAIVGSIPAIAKQAAESKKEPAAKKETKWQGHVSSTQWTKLGKPGEQDEIKEGSFVIVLGQVDDKGVLHATRIDLRLPR